MKTRWRTFGAVTAALACLLSAAGASCTSSDGTQGGIDASVETSVPIDASASDAADVTDAAAPHDAPADLTTSALIGPSGGTVRLADGTTVVIPPGALTAPLFVTLATAHPTLAGQSPVGGAARIDPLDAPLLKPVTITLPLDSARVPADADTSSLVVARSPDGNAPFVALASTADVNAKTVTASSIAFGVYAPLDQPSALFITTPSPLPRATVGTPYATSFAAVGGSLPYAWSIPAGSAPPAGLSLASTGAFSGSATSAGSTSFFVLVTDAHAHATQAVFECDVDPPANPVPVLVSISPTSAPRGSAAQTIVLTGSSFVPTSQALFDGVTLPTAYSTPGQLVATIPASSLTTAGAHAVTVQSPAPGGGTSAAQAFTVTAGNLAPTLTSVSPSTIPQGSPDTQVTLVGTSFASTSVAQIGGQSLSTLYVSDTQLDAIVPAALLATPGTLSISVATPPPGGGTSASQSITVTSTAPPPTPTITGISPSTIPAGWGDTDITLTGTNFDQNGRVFFPYLAYGSVAIRTTVNSATSLTATVRQCMLVNSGTVTVTYAANAADAGTPPDGGASASTALVVGAPDAGTCDPAQCAAGVAKAVCQDNKCCGGVGGHSTTGSMDGCCSGLSKLNVCYDGCALVGQYGTSGNCNNEVRSCCGLGCGLDGRCH